jgi:glycosyltransferase involved in cell wall biosynthesis
VSHILAVTDRIGGNLTNGSQVFADALLRRLAEHTEIAVVANTADGDAGRFTQCVELPDGTDEDLAAALASGLDLNDYTVFYNLGGTSYSCRVSRVLHELRPFVPLVNHFQVNLATYARHEGANAEECSREGNGQSEAAAIGDRNLFPSFAELHEARIQGWECQGASVVPNAWAPAESVKAGERSGRFTFFAAGRFSDYAKGADLLYRAFAGLADRGARLEIAADEPRFLELLDRLPEGSWKYHGWLDRERLHQAIRGCDCAVVPSRYEPFGLVAIEAMACGLPVIAMAVGGLAETVHHGSTGWLCPPEEGSFGLRLAMERALSDPERARAMGAAARRIARREYTFARVERQVLAHLENAEARQGRGLIDEWMTANA